MDIKLTLRARIKQKLRIRHPLLREGLAEFLGTFTLILLGDGSVAQSVLSKKEAGTFLSINWAWGLAVAMGIWVSGGVSGGHINPAVSSAMAVLGRLPIYKLPFYMTSQYAGAFLASCILYVIYHDALHHFDAGNRTVSGPLGTAGIWATYPQEYLSISSGFWDQVCGTAILLLCVLAITDERNMKPPKGMLPFAIGLIVTAIGMSFGVNCGYAINPARDLGPRIFTAVAGWGLDVFSVRNFQWFWVPIVATHIGAVFGSLVYLIIIGIHFPDLEDEEINRGDKSLSSKITERTPRELNHGSNLEDWSALDDIKDIRKI